MAILSGFFPEQSLIAESGYFSIDLFQYEFTPASDEVLETQSTIGVETITRVVGDAFVQTLSGLIANNYADDFYDRIHVKP